MSLRHCVDRATPLGTVILQTGGTLSPFKNDRWTVHCARCGFRMRTNTEDEDPRTLFGMSRAYHENFGRNFELSLRGLQVRRYLQSEKRDGFERGVRNSRGPSAASICAALIVSDVVCAAVESIFHDAGL